MYNLNVEIKLNNARIRVLRVSVSNHDYDNGGRLNLLLGVMLQRAPFSTRLCSGTSDMRYYAKICFYRRFIQRFRFGRSLDTLHRFIFCFETLSMKHLPTKDLCEYSTKYLNISLVMPLLIVCKRSTFKSNSRLMREIRK